MAILIVKYSKKLKMNFNTLNINLLIKQITILQFFFTECEG